MQMPNNIMSANSAASINSRAGAEIWYLVLRKKDKADNRSNRKNATQGSVISARKSIGRAINHLVAPTICIVLIKSVTEHRETDGIINQKNN